MVCSWMDHNSSSFGMVFREQANVIQKDFNFVFLTLQKIGIKDVLKKLKIVSFNEVVLKESSERFIYCNYLNSSFLPERINNFVEKISVRLIKSKLKNEEFNLIHAQSLIEAGFFSYLLSKSLRLPYLITEHSQLNFTGVSIGRHKMYQKVLDSAKQRLIVSNDKIRQYAMNRLYGRFLNIGNFANDEIFKFTSIPKTQDKFKIITVGAFSKIKDQITLLKALKVLDKKLTDVTIEFTWVGFSGWRIEKDDAVRKLIESMVFENVKVSLIPIATRQEVAKKLNESDLFLFSSISEGMPLAVLEALSCGLPVISTRCGGVEEVIDSNNGLLVDVMDYKDMALKINEIIVYSDNYNSAEISKAAISKFGKNAFSEKIAKVYNEVLSEN